MDSPGRRVGSAEEMLKCAGCELAPVFAGLPTVAYMIKQTVCELKPGMILNFGVRHQQLPTAPRLCWAALASDLMWGGGEQISQNIFQEMLIIL